MNAILYVLENGIKWRAMPRHAAGVRSRLAPLVHRLPLLPQVAEGRPLGEGRPGPGPPGPGAGGAIRLSQRPGDGSARKGYLASQSVVTSGARTLQTTEKGGPEGTTGRKRSRGESARF
jgi:hypothetical protein